MNIAILKGGKYRKLESVNTAQNILKDLKKGIEESKIKKIYDVHIDENNNWIHAGIDSDIHKIFSNVDHVLDTTHRDKHIKTKENLLSHKMGLMIDSSVFNKEQDLIFLRKVLDQLNVRSPKYVVIKRSFRRRINNDAKVSHVKDDSISESIYKLWRTHSMPIIIKSSSRKSFTLETSNPREALEHIHSIHSVGDDAVIEEKILGRNYSMVSLKNHRGEKIYMTSIFEKFDKENKNTFSRDYRRSFSLNETEKEYIKNTIKNIHSHLDNKFVKFDFVKSKTGFVFTHVNTKPSYDDDSLLRIAFESHGINFTDLI